MVQYLRFSNLVALAMACAVFGIPVSSRSATINIQTSATGWFNVLDQDSVSNDTAVTGQTNSTTNAFVSTTDVVDGQTQISNASAGSTVNIVTGELKSRTDTAYEGYYAENGTHASTLINLAETFTVSGSGTVDAYFLMTGSYFVSGIGFPFPTDPGAGITVPNVSLQGSGGISLTYGSGYSIQTNNDTDPGNLCAAVGGCSATSGSISDLLIASLPVSDVFSTELFLDVYMYAQLINGAGYFDFANTGKLLIATSPGLTLTASDSQFLTNPSLVLSPVPLPAALPLFAAGLAGLGFMGWVRKRRAQHG